MGLLVVYALRRKAILALVVVEVVRKVRKEQDERDKDQEDQEEKGDRHGHSQCPNWTLTARPDSSSN